MKRDDFIGSNREKSNIAIAPYTYFSYFGGSNNIFAGCKKTGYYNGQVRTLVPLDINLIINRSMKKMQILVSRFHRDEDCLAFPKAK